MATGTTEYEVQTLFYNFQDLMSREKHDRELTALLEDGWNEHRAVVIGDHVAVTYVKVVHTSELYEPPF